MADFFEHLTIGPCWWDILGTVLLIAACVFVFVRKSRLKKEKEELERGMAK